MHPAIGISQDDIAGGNRAAFITVIFNLVGLEGGLALGDDNIAGGDHHPGFAVG